MTIDIQQALPDLGGGTRALSPDRIDRVAMEFEAAFLSEMLRHSGLAAVAGAPGSAGENFSVFLLRAVAEEMARTSPLGIGEAVAEALRRSEGG